VHTLAERVLSHIRRQELLGAGDRVGVAVSGGIDSVALLRLLWELRDELGIVLSVVHFNHRLRGAESDADEEFVANLARAYDLEFYSDSDDVAQQAAEEHVSVEAAARELRYGFFRSLLGEDGGPQGLQPGGDVNTSLRGPEGPLFHELDKIATGHTLDDQAETVLMRMIRGTGPRGLGGIHPRLFVEDDDGEISGEIVRPLLAIRHRELEQYLKDIGQPWREDSTNTDERFTRNRVRQRLVPLLEREFNPSVAENLAELAEIARGEEDYWENEISGWLGTIVQWAPPDWARDAASEAGATRGALKQNLVQIELSGNPSTGNEPPLSFSIDSGSTDTDLQARIDGAPWLAANASVSRMWFLGEPLAVQRRLAKAIGERAGIPLEFKHVEEILRLASDGGAHGELSLPLGWKMVLEPAMMIFQTPDLRNPAPSRDYEYELPIPSRIIVGESGSWIEVRCVSEAGQAAYNPDHLLDADSLPEPLRVRNWRPGDRYWPAHTKSPKKIKELLQERRVAQQERRSWPVVVGGDEIVWMRGFPVPAKFRAKPGRDAIAIIDEPFAARHANED
jgi:tRNA(Ile)-lysidine synthase